MGKMFGRAIENGLPVVKYTITAPQGVTAALAHSGALTNVGVNITGMLRPGSATARDGVEGLIC